MSSDFFRINDLPVAPAVAKDYLRWKAGHDKNCPCGVPLRITSGFRSKQDQHDTFVSRYRVGAFSPWGDYRRYQGKTWGRISGKGTVMSPDDVSNHTLGFALDVNISSGGVCQRWNLANAGKYGFNWVEGKSAREPWHWVWRITFRPGKSAPDPWEGRGMPREAPKSDPGMTRDELYGKSPTPAVPAVVPEEEDDNMKMLGYKNPTDGRVWYAQYDTTSGFWYEWVSSDKDYIRDVADKWTPNGIPPVSLDHRNGLKAECDRIAGRVA